MSRDPRERLARHLPRLGAARRDVERALAHARTDPKGSLNAARCAAEAILIAVLARGGKVEEKATIEQLKARVGRKALGRAWNHLEHLQRLGNDGSHHGPDEMDEGDADAGLLALANLADWYVARTGGARPRGSWGTTVPLLATGAVASMLVAFGALSWLNAAAPVRATAVVAPAAPPPTAAVVSPVRAPAAAPAYDDLPLSARPLLPGEPIDADLAVCVGVPVVRPTPLGRVGSWVRVAATCGGSAVGGWIPEARLASGGLDVATVPARTAATRSDAGDDALAEARGAARAGRWSEAVAGFEAALALVGEDPAVHEELGEARAAAEQPDAALGDYALCLDLAPERVSCARRAALLLRALGRPAAPAAWARAVALDPALASTRFVTSAGGLPLYEPLDGRLLHRPVPLAQRVVLCQLAEGAAVELVDEDPGGRRGPDAVRVRARCGQETVVGDVEPRLATGEEPP